MRDGSYLMPVRARPYHHQNEAFAFACEKFGLTSPYKSSSGIALLHHRVDCIGIRGSEMAGQTSCL